MKNKKFVKKYPIILIGAGGHARVLMDALRLNHCTVLGAMESDEKILRYAPSKVRLVNGVGSVNVSPKRRQIFEKFKKKGYVFLTVTHPSAVIASDVILGEGAQVMAGAVIQTGSRIGDNTIINTRASVDHDCVIGSHVHCAPGVILSGHVRIQDDAHLGTGAVVVQNVSIPEKSFVRAQSLVKSDLGKDAQA